MSSATPEAPPTSGQVLARLDRLPATRRQVFWVGLLGAGYLVETFDNTVFGYVAPALRAEWGLDIGHIGLINSAVFVGMFIGAIFGGQLSDRFGRKPVLVWGSVFYALASLMSAFAPNFETMFLSRVLTGIGVQAATGVIMVILSEMFPSASRGRFFTVMTFCGFIAAPLTSMTALAIVPRGDGAWRWVFVLGSAGLIIAIVVAAAMPETVRWLLSHGREEEAVRVVARLERSAARRGPLPPVAPMADVERNGTFRDLFKRRYARRLVVMTTAFGALIFCLYGFVSWVPTVLVGRGLPQSEALAMASAISFGSLLAPVVLFFLADRIERKTAILGAACLGGVGMAVFGFATDATTTIASGFVVQVALSSLTTSYYTYLPEVFPTSVRGIGAGVVNGAGRIAGILSGIAVAALYSAQGAGGLYLVLGCGLIAMGVFAAAFGPRTTRRSLESISEG